jgi:hypothetical protein
MREGFGSHVYFLDTEKFRAGWVLAPTTCSNCGHSKDEGTHRTIVLADDGLTITCVLPKMTVNPRLLGVIDGIH